MVFLEVLFLLFQPAVETALRARGNVRLVVASTAIQGRQQADADIVDLRQRVFRQVAVHGIFRQHDFATRGSEATTCVVSGIPPIEHLVGFENREIAIFLGQRLSESGTAARLSRTDTLQVGSAGGENAQRADNPQDL
jgi:hypothetical protein